MIDVQIHIMKHSVAIEEIQKSTEMQLIVIFHYLFLESLESIGCGDLKSLNGEAVYVDVAVTTRPYKATCMHWWGVQRGEEEDQKNREWCTYVKAHETTQLTLFFTLDFFSSDTVVPVFHLI